MHIDAHAGDSYAGRKLEHQAIDRLQGVAVIERAGKSNQAADEGDSNKGFW